MIYEPRGYGWRLRTLPGNCAHPVPGVPGPGRSAPLLDAFILRTIARDPPLRLKPGHVPSLKGLGRCYVRRGQPCRALRCYKQYARRRPGVFFVKRHIKTLSKKCGAC